MTKNKKHQPEADQPVAEENKVTAPKIEQDVDVVEENVSEAEITDEKPKNLKTFRQSGETRLHPQ